MKRMMTILLSALLLFSALPLTAAAEDNAVADIEYAADVPCLERDLPHGESVWQAIYALEKSLPDSAAPGDYAALTDQVEAIVRSSDEVAAGSVRSSGDMLSWDTLDGMAHGYSPELRYEINGYFDEETAASQTKITPEAKKQLDPVGAAADDPVGFGSTSSKDIAVFMPYSGFSGDNWDDEAPLASSLATLTGGSYKIYKNSSATVDKIAEALETCAVVIIDTHGSTDKRGIMNDTSMANSSYITLTSGTGITTADCQWETGRCGEFRHAFYGGSPPEASGNDVYFVDGTTIANHMNKTAPNNLLWMDSCLTMSTDGLAAPLRDKGVGVILGYSKPISCIGGAHYKRLFFDKLKSGATVADSANYMRQMAGSSWDPYYNLTESEAVAAGIAFPIFVSSIDTYPGQYNVDSVQTVMSDWRLPFNNDNESNYCTKAALMTGMLQRVDCKLRFLPHLTSAKLSSGSLPDGMNFYWSSGELYVRGTPTKKGVFNATFSVNDTVYGEQSHKVSLVVSDKTVNEASQNITFTSGYASSATVCSSCVYYQYQSGYLPRNTTVEMSGSNLKFSGTTYVPPGEYKVVYDLIDSSYTRYRKTVTITVKPYKTYNLSSESVSMARGCKGIVRIKEASSAYYSVEITSGSIPNGTVLVSRNSKHFNIIGTPTATGTFTCSIKLSKGYYAYTMNLTVTVREPANINATITRYDFRGGSLGSVTQRCGSTYTLPQYSESVASNLKFTGWMSNRKVYQPGETVSVDAMQMEFYAMCEYKTNTVIDSVSCTIGEPVGGLHPDRYPVSGDSSKYTVKLSSWAINESPYTQLKATDTFVLGKQYSVSIVFTPRAGYTLDSSTTYKINGSTPARADNGVAIAVYTAASPSVSKVDCLLDTPVGTEHPDYTAIPRYAGYSAKVDYWYLNQKPEYTHLSANDSFTGGRSYRVRVKYTANDGCIFTDNATFMINGKTATYVGASTYEVIYTAATYIDSVRVYGTAVAVAGKKASENPPQYTLNTTNCSITLRLWSKMRLISLSPIKISYSIFTSEFEKGSTYYPQITLKPGTNYLFADTVKVTFDDAKTVNVSPSSDGTLLVRAAGVEATADSSVLIGDVNGDGKVNGADAGILNRYTSGWSGYKDKIKNMDAADINGDGKVNGADSGILNRYTSGWSGYDKYFT